MNTETFFNCEPGQEPFEQLMEQALSTNPDEEAESLLGKLFQEGDFI